jgi:hypothetical protein
VFALVLAGFVAFAVAQAPGPAAVAPTPAGAAGTSATPQGSCPSGLAAQAVSCSEVHGVQRPEPEIAGDEPNPGGVLAPSGVTLP